VLDRAVRRGDLAQPPDPDVVHALLLGPVFAWLFLLGKPGDDRLVATLTDLATAALIRVPPGPPR
jgi:Tetracyclin repressor-like, C-terminal domain